MEKELLVHDVDEQKYRTTEKGRQYLKMYKDVGQMIYPNSIKKK
jgi:predicted transcriptional regulator